jgi:DNA mismatch repair protein MutL
MHVEADDITISGFVAAPHHHRANRSGQYLLINGRNVQAPFLSNCVREGYGTLLPTQRHPLFVLTVALPADTIDVNVHPQKREVRFLREPLLKQLMRRGIEAALHHIPQEPLAQNTLHPLASLTAATQQQPIANSWIDDSPTIWMPPLERIDTGDRVVPVKMPHPNAVAAQNSTADLKPLPWENSSIVATPYAAPLPPPVSTQLKLAMDTSQLPIPTLIATLPGYLLLNSNDACKSRLLTTQLSSAPALFLVDHRRAHQRILYEKLISARTTAIEVQSLLIPYALDFVPADHLIIQEQQVELGALGLALQQIGPHSWSVESIPICLGNVDLAILFEQLINAWRQTAHLAAPIDHLLAKQLCAAASKAAVQGESQLSMAEGQALLEQLWHCRQPALCPSGMPTAAYFTTAELQRRFQNSA